MASRTKRRSGDDGNKRYVAYETAWRNFNLRFRRAPPTAKPKSLSDDGSGDHDNEGDNDDGQQQRRPPIPLMVERITGRITGMAMFLSSLTTIGNKAMTDASTSSMVSGFYHL